MEFKLRNPTKYNHHESGLSGQTLRQYTLEAISILEPKCGALFSAEHDIVGLINELQVVNFSTIEIPTAISQKNFLTEADNFSLDFIKVLASARLARPSLIKKQINETIIKIFTSEYNAFGEKKTSLFDAKNNVYLNEMDIMQLHMQDAIDLIELIKLIFFSTKEE